MIQRLTMQLPRWARSDHPVVRYELGKNRAMTRRNRYGRALGTALIVLVFILIAAVGYLVATGFLQRPAGQTLTEGAIAVLFWPTLATQLLLRIGALLYTANAVSEQVRRQTWDSLRATEHGAELAIRARWATVFYRLRGLLGLVLVVRILLIAGILYDLTGFQGRYLDLLINGITPDIPLVLAILLVSFLMTAALLLPFTAVGLDAAIGLLLSTFVQQRTYGILLQILIIFLRLLLVGALLWGASQALRAMTPMEGWQSWLLIGGFAAMGDWGVSFLHLGGYGQTAAAVPYGIFFGLALLAFAMIQAVVTDWLLSLAIRRAERVG